MISFRLGRSDAATIRFTPSPLNEVVFSLRAVATRWAGSPHRAYVDQVRPRLSAQLDLAPLRALIPPAGYVPDFLTPPPAAVPADIETQPDQVRATPAEDVVADVTWLTEDPGIPAGRRVDAGFVAVGHVVPARLDKAAADLVRTRVVAARDQVGLREGPAHTEAILGAAGLHLVESHARTGGDDIPGLVRLVTGRDLETDRVAHAAGVDLPAPVASVAPAAAKAYVVAHTAGRVTAVNRREAALAVPGVRAVELTVTVRDGVRPPTASWDRLGEVVAVGDAPEHAGAAADRARRLITITIDAPRPDRETTAG